MTWIDHHAQQRDISLLTIAYKVIFVYGETACP